MVLKTLCSAMYLETFLIGHYIRKLICRHIGENRIRCILRSHAGISFMVTMKLMTVDQTVMKWDCCAVWFATLHRKV